MGNPRLAGGAAPAVLSFPGTTFNYDPTQGNLLVDIQISGIGHSGTPAAYDAHNDNAGGIYSRAHNFDGGFEDYGLKTEFVVPLPVAAWLALPILAGLGVIKLGKRSRVV